MPLTIPAQLIEAAKQGSYGDEHSSLMRNNIVTSLKQQADLAGEELAFSQLMALLLDESFRYEGRPQDLFLEKIYTLADDIEFDTIKDAVFKVMRVERGLNPGSIEALSEAEAELLGLDAGQKYYAFRWNKQFLQTLTTLLRQKALSTDACHRLLGNSSLHQDAQLQSAGEIGSVKDIHQTYPKAQQTLAFMLLNHLFPRHNPVETYILTEQQLTGTVKQCWRYHLYAKIQEQQEHPKNLLSLYLATTFTTDEAAHNLSRSPDEIATLIDHATKNIVNMSPDAHNIFTQCYINALNQNLIPVTEDANFEHLSTLVNSAIARHEPDNQIIMTTQHYLNQCLMAQVNAAQARPEQVGTFMTLKLESLQRALDKLTLPTETEQLALFTDFIKSEFSTLHDLMQKELLGEHVQPIIQILTTLVDKYKHRHQCRGFVYAMAEMLHTQDKARESGASFNPAVISPLFGQFQCTEFDAYQASRPEEQAAGGGTAAAKLQLKDVIAQWNSYAADYQTGLQQREDKQAYAAQEQKYTLIQAAEANVIRTALAYIRASNDTIEQREGEYGQATDTLRGLTEDKTVLSDYKARVRQELLASTDRLSTRAIIVLNNFGGDGAFFVNVALLNWLPPVTIEAGTVCEITDDDLQRITVALKEHNERFSTAGGAAAQGQTPKNQQRLLFQANLVQQVQQRLFFQAHLAMAAKNWSQAGKIIDSLYEIQYYLNAPIFDYPHQPTTETDEMWVVEESITEESITTLRQFLDLKINPSVAKLSSDRLDALKKPNTELSQACVEALGKAAQTKIKSTFGALSSQLGRRATSKKEEAPQTLLSILLEHPSASLTPTQAPPSATVPEATAPPAAGSGVEYDPENKPPAQQAFLYPPIEGGGGGAGHFATGAAAEQEGGAAQEISRLMGTLSPDALSSTLTALVEQMAAQNTAVDFEQLQATYANIKPSAPAP